MHANQREEIKEILAATSLRAWFEGRDDWRDAVRPESLITLERMVFRSR